MFVKECVVMELEKVTDVMETAADKKISRGDAFKGAAAVVGSAALARI